MNKLKFVLLLMVLSIFTITSVWAVKATPEIIRMKQPDGTILMVKLHGDENAHYLTTVDGYVILRDKDGFLKYALFKQDTPLQVSNIIARNLNERSIEEANFVSKLTPAAKIAGHLLKSEFKRTPGRTLSKEILNPQKFGKNKSYSPKEGNPADSKFLVILVNFKDSKFKFQAKDFDNWLNEPGYSVKGGTGSVKDYYKENSMGQFIPDFDVYGPIELDYPVKYYGENSGGSGTDLAPQEMIEEACKKVKQAHSDLNFAIYDNDNDGIMDNVNIIFAGYSEATTGEEDLIWPHTYHLDGSLKIDGISIYSYACSAEFVGASGEEMDGIGTFTHEFGHVLGLKDLYDTDEFNGGLALDPGAYSLMASGSYNNNSRTPPYLMTFEKVMLGWCFPEELKEAADISLPPIETGKSYFINAQPNRNPSTGYEMFILENRQRKGWDSYLPAHGLLIYHWDFTEEAIYNYWSVNGPNNNAKHRCLYIKCADGIDNASTRNSDTYPGRSGNTEFTDTSTPNALSWSGEKTNVPITNIREEKEIIHFQVKGGIKSVSQIKTGVPYEITETSAKVTAKVITKNATLKEMGFCWAKDVEPTVEKSSKQTVAISDEIEYQLSGLEPNSCYNVRAYMITNKNDIFYGAAIPFNTECATKTAPYIDDFTSWTDGILDCWKIIDANKDGTTWVYDKNTEAIVYTFDYWNNANDWLISPKIEIPQNGHLFFSRAITEVGYTEDLEIWISTKSKDLKDFHLYKKFSFGDYYGLMHFEEVNLELYCGQTIYVAFVCRSEKLSNALWLKDIYVTSKLPAPLLKTFGPYENETGETRMRLQWDPIERAENYHVTVEQEQNIVSTYAIFLSEADYAEITNVEVSSGKLFFTESGSAETIDYPDGITNVMFIYTGFGPIGKSTVTIQGTEDGNKWEQIGPTLQITGMDELEHYLTEYIKNKKYRKLRFNCTWNGRNVVLKYLTLQYNENKTRVTVTEGSPGNVTDIMLPINYFTPGETYIAYVYASDGILFYDSSNEISYFYDPTSIANTQKELTTVTANGQTIFINHIEKGSKIECIGISGEILANCLTDGSSLTIKLNGYSGLVFVRITDKNQRQIFKVLTNK